MVTMLCIFRRHHYIVNDPSLDGAIWYLGYLGPDRLHQFIKYRYSRCDHPECLPPTSILTATAPDPYDERNIVCDESPLLGTVLPLSTSQRNRQQDRQRNGQQDCQQDRQCADETKTGSVKQLRTEPDNETVSKKRIVQAIRHMLSQPETAPAHPTIQQPEVPRTPAPMVTVDYSLSQALDPAVTTSGILADYDSHTMLFYDSSLLATDYNASTVAFQLIALAWNGWYVHWTPAGTAAFARYVQMHTDEPDHALAHCNSNPSELSKIPFSCGNGTNQLNLALRTLTSCNNPALTNGTLCHFPSRGLLSFRNSNAVYVFVTPESSSIATLQHCGAIKAVAHELSGEYEPAMAACHVTCPLRRQTGTVDALDSVDSGSMANSDSTANFSSSTIGASFTGATQSSHRSSAPDCSRGCCPLLNLDARPRRILSPLSFLGEHRAFSIVDFEWKLMTGKERFSTQVAGDFAQPDAFFPICGADVDITSHTISYWGATDVNRDVALRKMYGNDWDFCCLGTDYRIQLHTLRLLAESSGNRTLLKMFTPTSGVEEGYFPILEGLARQGADEFTCFQAAGLNLLNIVDNLISEYRTRFGSSRQLPHIIGEEYCSQHHKAA